MPSKKENLTKKTKTASKASAPASPPSGQAIWDVEVALKELLAQVANSGKVGQKQLDKILLNSPNPRDDESLLKKLLLKEGVVLGDSREPNLANLTLRSATDSEINPKSGFDEISVGVGKTLKNKNETVARLEEDITRSYLKDIGRYDLLKPEEEKELARRVKKGDLEAKKEMVRRNLRLVVSIAKTRHYHNQGLDFLDLIQAGNVGLMKAVDKFDLSKGFRFSTYATWWIRQGVDRDIANNARTIRIPVHANENIKKMTRIQRRLQQEFDRDPTKEEIAKEIGLDVSKVEHLMKIKHHPDSLDQAIREGEDDATLSERTADNDLTSPEDLAGASLCQDQVRSAMDQYLNDREKKIIEMLYGLEDGRSWTLEEVGRELDITRERVRQIEHNAINKLKRNKDARRLKQNLDTIGV